MSAIIGIYVLLVGIWVWFKPWTSAPQRWLFYVAIQPLPLYVMASSNEDPSQILLSYSVWALGSFLVIKKLHKTDKLSDLFSRSRNPQSDISWSELLFFYGLCALYVFLYG